MLIDSEKNIKINTTVCQRVAVSKESSYLMFSTPDFNGIEVMNKLFIGWKPEKDDVTVCNDSIMDARYGSVGHMVIYKNDAQGKPVPVYEEYTHPSIKGNAERIRFTNLQRNLHPEISVERPYKVMQWLKSLGGMGR
ncbi:MAG: hypothetical protein IJ529_04910 [Alphaproteobacteria bacterium]|nr:hypothetical protein [Alphaproteobacteria bacterium]